MDRDSNGYDVATIESADGWHVVITDPGGTVVAERACRDGAEARTYASTVRQHAYWLSPSTFREYYRLPQPG